MDSKKKKIIIITSIVATIGAIIGVIIYVGRKSKSNVAITPSSTSAGANTAVSTTGTTYKFVNAFVENNLFTIQYQPMSDTFATGDTIKFLTPSSLAGKTAKITGLKNFTSGGLISGSGQNLYLDLPWADAYKNISGTFTKA